MSKHFYTKKRFWYWFGGIALSLLIILVMGITIIAVKWKPVLSSKLKEGVKKASGELYTLDFKDLHLNPLRGTVTLDNVVFWPDSNVFNQLKLQKKAPVHLFRVKLEHLKITRIGILDAYFKKELHAKAILLDNPSIDMVYHKGIKRTNDTASSENLYQILKNILNSIEVKLIKVIDADFDYYNADRKLSAVKHVNIRIEDLLIDSLTSLDTTRVLYSKNIGFELGGYKSLTQDKMYTIKIDSVRGSLNKSSLEVKGFKVIPMYPELEFSRQYKVQKDRYDLDFSSITLNKVDFTGLSNNGNLQVKKMTIGPAKVAVFMNRSLPPPDIDKGRNFPHVALQRLPLPTVIEQVVLNKVDVAYTEFNPETNNKGTVKLQALSGTLSNLTNDSLRLNQYNHAYADLNTMIMGAAKMNVKIDFNLAAKNGAFSYYGTVGSFDMKVLNAISKPLGQMEIESGHANSATFNVNANFNQASGKIVFLYNGLKIKMLGEDGDGKEKKKGLLSFLANTLLIKDDNPTGNNPQRIAYVDHNRVKQASFFNLMWKTVLKGIRETASVGMIPMKKMPPPKKGIKK
ncbi:AsmA family protein [Pedobacter montanisoli]|uniref:DUF748 domain-containing protein n=1 Tax=Pedobacter montanisoli TaxID=2923277 RepID=A0ABS9ZVK6_9SPHI|nr:hypothetical protein [Pedobacter montanisoli]MCJ0742154.1 hypothetical protein [Pedobacter montanisoli]